MRRLSISFAVLLGISMAGVAPAQSPVEPPLAVVRRLFDGMRAGDSSAIRALFHPRARLISSAMQGGVPVTRIEESVDGFLKSVGTPHAEVWDERTTNEKVFVDGPLASVWADYTFFLSGKLSHCGIDHFLLAQEGSAWKIIELADTRRRDGCSG